MCTCAADSCQGQPGYNGEQGHMGVRGNQVIATFSCQTTDLI